jgi:hypothetical protein
MLHPETALAPEAEINGDFLSHGGTRGNPNHAKLDHFRIETHGFSGPVFLKETSRFISLNYVLRVIPPTVEEEEQGIMKPRDPRYGIWTSCMSSQGNTHPNSATAKLEHLERTCDQNPRPRQGNPHG